MEQFSFRAFNFELHTSGCIEGTVVIRSTGGSQAGAIIARGLETSRRRATQVGIGVFHQRAWGDGEVEITVEPPIAMGQSRGARIATTTRL